MLNSSITGITQFIYEFKTVVVTTDPFCPLATLITGGLRTCFRNRMTYKIQSLLKSFDGYYVHVSSIEASEN